MAYVSVKGGEKAIENAHQWLAEERRGDPAVEEVAVAQIREQLSLAVDRVMAEGSCYDRDLAALALELGHLRGLVGRQHLGDDLADAELGGDALGS